MRQPVPLQKYGWTTKLLMYCCVQSRLDVAYEVKELSRHLTNLSHAHDKAADRVIRYLYHMRHLGLVMGRASDGLLGYTDANHLLKA